MFSNDFPAREDVITVRIEEAITDIGFNAILLEYGGLKGLLQQQEISKRRLKRGKRYFKVGQIIECSVLRVDKDKGYIDLSCKRVDDEGARAQRQSFVQAKQVHSILINVAESLNRELEDVCRRVSWPLYEDHGSAFEAFTQAVRDPHAALSQLNLDGELFDALVTAINKKFSVPAYRLRLDVEATCFSSAGVNGLRDAFMSAEAKYPDVKVFVVASPVYSLNVTANERETGVARLHSVFDTIAASLVESGGHCKMVAEPYLING